MRTTIVDGLLVDAAEINVSGMGNFFDVPVSEMVGDIFATPREAVEVLSALADVTTRTSEETVEYVVHELPNVERPYSYVMLTLRGSVDALRQDIAALA